MSPYSLSGAGLWFVCLFGTFPVRTRTEQRANVPIKSPHVELIGAFPDGKAMFFDVAYPSWPMGAGRLHEKRLNQQVTYVGIRDRIKIIPILYGPV